MSGQSETWRAIPGYEGFYEVSDAGHVRRVARGRGTRIGVRRTTTNGHYLKITLSRFNIQRQRYIHDLVAAAFIGAKPKGKSINHRDSDKRNNRVENLEYVTPAENVRHAIANGRVDHAGEKNSQALLTWQDVREIRTLRTQGIRCRDIAEWFGIARHTVEAIVAGRRWKPRVDIP